MTLVLTWYVNFHRTEWCRKIINFDTVKHWRFICIVNDIALWFDRVLTAVHNHTKPRLITGYNLYFMLLLFYHSKIPKSFSLFQKQNHRRLVLLLIECVNTNIDYFVWKQCCSTVIQAMNIVFFFNKKYFIYIHSILVNSSHFRSLLAETSRNHYIKSIKRNNHIFLFLMKPKI